MNSNRSRETLQNIETRPEHAYPVYIVDDLPANRLLLKKLLAKEGYGALHLFASASPMLEALNTSDNLPGLILLDIMMPDMNGIEVLQYLQENECFRDIPVIMVTAHQEDRYLSEAFEKGAVDYIRKPVNRTELLARVHAALRLKQEMDIRKARELELLKTKEELEEANRELRRLAREDGLTGLANRRYFEEILEKEWRRHQREDTPLGLILLDVDFFKRYNDTYGHQQGDVCLQKVASVLKTIAHRPADLAARYGGEEFALILPNTEVPGVEYLAKLINRRVEALQIPHSASDVASVVTVSVGCSVSFQSSAPNMEALIKQADAALYQAKENGRNQYHYLPLQ